MRARSHASFVRLPPPEPRSTSQVPRFANTVAAADSGVADSDARSTSSVRSAWALPVASLWGAAGRGSCALGDAGPGTAGPRDTGRPAGASVEVSRSGRRPHAGPPTPRRTPAGASAPGAPRNRSTDAAAARRHRPAPTSRSVRERRVGRGTRWDSTQGQRGRGRGVHGRRRVRPGSRPGGTGLASAPSRGAPPHSPEVVHGSRNRRSAQRREEHAVQRPDARRARSRRTTRSRRSSRTSAWSASRTTA